MKTRARLWILLCSPLLVISQVKEVSYVDYNCENIQVVEDNCTHFKLVTGFYFLGDYYEPGETIELCSSYGSTFLGSNIGYLNIIFSDASSLKLEFNHSKYGELVFLYNRNTKQAMIYLKYDQSELVKFRIDEVSNSELAKAECKEKLRLAENWGNVEASLSGTLNMLEEYNEFLYPTKAVFYKSILDEAEYFLQQVNFYGIGTTQERVDLRYSVEYTKERLFKSAFFIYDPYFPNSFIDSIVQTTSVFHKENELNDIIDQYIQAHVDLCNERLDSKYKWRNDLKIEVADNFLSLIKYLREYRKYHEGIGWVEFSQDSYSDEAKWINIERLNLYKLLHDTKPFRYVYWDQKEDIYLQLIDPILKLIMLDETQSICEDSLLKPIIIKFDSETELLNFIFNGKNYVLDGILPEKIEGDFYTFSDTINLPIKFEEYHVHAMFTKESLLKEWSVHAVYNWQMPDAGKKFFTENDYSTLIMEAYKKENKTPVKFSGTTSFIAAKPIYLDIRLELVKGGKGKYGRIMAFKSAKPEDYIFSGEWVLLN